MRDLLFQSLRYPKESLSVVNRQVSKSLWIPKHIYMVFLERSIPGPQIYELTTVNVFVGGWHIIGEKSLQRVVPANKTRARFRLNPQEPNSLKSMRVVSVLCTSKRAVILQWNKNPQLFRWRYYFIVTDGHGRPM